MSDNKKLLSENTIRRFMTLANVGPLSDNFIQEKVHAEKEKRASQMKYCCLSKKWEPLNRLCFMPKRELHSAMLLREVH